MNQIQKKKNGFTMVELIIVVAIIGIIGTLVVPAFGPMVTKAKISSDLATVKTLKRTADIYKAEQGKWPQSNNLEALNSKLITDKYLDSEVKFQIDGAEILMNDTDKTIKLDLSASTAEDIIPALNTMDQKTVDEWIEKPSASN